MSLVRKTEIYALTKINIKLFNMILNIYALVEIIYMKLFDVIFCGN